MRAKAEAERRRAAGSHAPQPAHRAAGGEYWNLVTAVAVVAWLVVLGYSALMLQPEASGRVRRVLFFPEVPYVGAADSDGLGAAPGGALRSLSSASVEPALRLLVEEAILGPADHRTHHLLPGRRTGNLHPRGGRRGGGMSRTSTCHTTPWLVATAVPSTGAERIRALTDIILFNFPRLQAVQVLIEGQEPRIDQAQIERAEGAHDG